jgi:hypothetical protein
MIYFETRFQLPRLMTLRQITRQASKLDRAVSSVMAARLRLLCHVNLVNIQPVEIVAFSGCRACILHLA